MAIAKFTQVVSFFKTTLSQRLSDTASDVTLDDVPGGVVEYPTWAVIEPQGANKELIYLPTAPTSLTYSSVVRGLDPESNNDTLAATFNKEHPANVEVIIAPTHRHWNELVKVMDGTVGTGANILRVGDETDVDVTIYAQNADAAKPYVQYDSATNKWLISNDGTSTFDITAGGSGLTAGAGIDITVSAITTKLNASGLLVKNLGAGTDELGITTDTAAALAGSSGAPSVTNKFVTQLDTAYIQPTGAVQMFAGGTTPSGWLLCDGTAVSRTTYSALFAVLSPTVGVMTVTIAAPGVATLTTHGLATGDSIYLTTTGALPTGLTINTRYWITKVDANSFKFATTLANALSSTNITTTGSQSGVHTVKGASYGIGDGTTTFNVPSLKSAVPVGKDQAATEFAGLGQTGGEKTHVLTTAELAAHNHTVEGLTAGGASAMGFGANGATWGNFSAYLRTVNAGSDAAHNNLQPYVTLNFIIKT